MVSPRRRRHGPGTIRVVGRTPLHLDTDLGTNPDDLAALALVLAHPEADLVAVTTVDDADGARADLVRHCLRLAGRADVPVADPRSGDADRLLAAAVGSGTAVVAIGPLTNLARLEEDRPGTLAAARVVAMGGWLHPLGPGRPDWGPGRDSNVVADPAAARVVLGRAGALTLVTLADTVRATLRAGDLTRLRAAGPLARLLAEQVPAHAVSRGLTALAQGHAGLPDDLALFLHDPLTVAVALGWPGVSLTAARVRPEPADGGLRLVPDESGREVTVVDEVDGPAFVAWWLDLVAAHTAGP